MFFSQVGYSLCLFVTIFAVSSHVYSTEKTAPKSVEELTQHPLRGLEKLIATTQKNLEFQIQLEKRLQKYLELKDKVLADQNQETYIQELILLAAPIWDDIQEFHLIAVFPQDFIEELSLFAQLANKHNIARP